MERPKTPPTARVSGSMLHDLAKCEHRVYLDLHGDPALRGEISEFVRMLWRAGSGHEDRIVAGLVDVVDLRGVRADHLAMTTLAAMDEGMPLIIGGEIAIDDLIGRPDLLELAPDGRYLPGDVKLGSAGEWTGSRARRLDYGLQLALYVDIRRRLGRLSTPRGFVLGGDGQRIDYPLDGGIGASSEPLLQRYEFALTTARRIVANDADTRPALAAQCKLCHWRSVCKAQIAASDDLTRIPQLGAALRDRMELTFPSVRALADATLPTSGKNGGTGIAGLGTDRLARFQDRARLLSDPAATAYARSPITLPTTRRELFYDVEVDPMRDGGLCYLHGIHERSFDAAGKATQRFHAFFAETPDAEGEALAFEGAWRLLTEDPDSVTYYWSKYERTTARVLQARHPHVCTPEDVEAFFAPTRSIDLLYDVVARETEWPLTDHSIKTIAVHLGFAWRDANPSGAASIEWYDRYVKEGDTAVRQRIIDYNEDDCRATVAVKDGVLALPVRTGPNWLGAAATNQPTRPEEPLF